MGHKLQANLHHRLLQLQASNKYDSICFMLQDLAKRHNLTWKEEHEVL